MEQNMKLARAERRRLERAINRLLKRDGDHCSLCRAPFTHNQQTYCGSAEGRAAVVGDCCLEKMDCVVAAGMFVSAVLREAYSDHSARQAQADWFCRGLQTSVNWTKATAELTLN